MTIEVSELSNSTKPTKWSGILRTSNDGKPKESVLVSEDELNS